LQLFEYHSKDCKIESILFQNSTQESDLEVMMYINYATEKTI
jgi:hypothetical protein